MKNKFEWTDELVCEFAVNIISGKLKPGKTLEQFKALKQPEYEILKGWNLNDDPHDWIGDDYGGCSCTEMGCKIYSVRRLSDNEVFTIGDKTNYGIIKTFEIMCGKCYIDTGNYIGWDINAVRIIKPPVLLLTTEDGKDCYGGETVYGVAPQASGNDVIREEKLPFIVHTNRKWFFDKEAAMDYIVKYKKCLCINDLLTIDHAGNGSTLLIRFDKLIKLVKENFNQP